MNTKVKREAALRLIDLLLTEELPNDLREHAWRILRYIVDERASQ